MVWLLRLGKIALLATSVGALLWVGAYLLVLVAAAVVGILTIIFLSSEADAVLGL